MDRLIISLIDSCCDSIIITFKHKLIDRVFINSSNVDYSLRFKKIVKTELSAKGLRMGLLCLEEKKYTLELWIISRRKRIRFF